MDVRELKHHKGVYMRSDAAIQLDKFEDDHGVISINRALVSLEDQKAVIRRWDKGGPANRPPNLYEPKRPPEDSEHVQGIAYDTSHVTHCLKHAGPYGFYQRYAWDKPHFEFDPSRVRIRPETPVIETEELPMNIMLYLYKPTNKLILADHLNKTMRDLGNDPKSWLRAQYQARPMTVVDEPDWTNRFKDYRYI